MAESSFFWGGTTVGDCGPYSDDTFSDFIGSLMQSDRTTQSVIKGSLNELAITNPGGVVIRVDTGRALVDGKLYENTAVVDFTVTAPGAGSNYYTLVLRKDFTAQTIRLALLGPSGSSYPSVTQTDGTTWEVSIAQVVITSAGAITITRTAQEISIPMLVTTAQIQDDAVTTAKIAAGNVTDVELGTGAVTETKLGTGAVTATKIGTDAVVTAKIQNDAVTNDKIADNAVGTNQIIDAGITAAKMASGVIPELIYKRRGGSADTWWMHGSTVYTPTNTIFQICCDVVDFTSMEDVQANVTVTFPEAFGKTPIIIPFFLLSVDAGMTIEAQSTSTSQTTLTARKVFGHIASSGTIGVACLAIGPKA